MTSNRGVGYWRTNPDWYYFDEEDNKWYVKETAPERAKRSFEMLHDYPAVKGAKEFLPNRVKYRT